jgi:hypothetical protein
MAAGDAERFVHGGVVVQIVVDAVAPHVAPAVGAEQAFDGFLRMGVGDVDGALVDQERHRIVGDEAVVFENKGERLHFGADNGHDSSPTKQYVEFKPMSASRVPFVVSLVARKSGSTPAPKRRRAVNLYLYWADKPTVVCDLTTGGGFHLPVSASDFGAYSRIVRLNGAFGAGSQLASLSLPGLSFWK